MSESLSCVRFNSSIAKVDVFDKTAIPDLHKSLNNMRDYYNILHTAKEEAERIGLERGLEKGLAQGLEQELQQGLAQGRAEERAAVISLMSANGMDDESISKMLEMDLDEVRCITGNGAAR